MTPQPWDMLFHHRAQQQLPGLRSCLLELYHRATGIVSWWKGWAQVQAGEMVPVSTRACCQTCCTDHDGSPRWLSFTPCFSQIPYWELSGATIPWCCRGWGKKPTRRENTMKGVWEGWERELRKLGKYQQLSLQRLPKIVSIWVSIHPPNISVCESP